MNTNVQTMDTTQATNAQTNTQSGSTHHHEVNTQTLYGWLANEDTILIDVREADEFAATHILCANSLPLSLFTPQTLATLGLDNAHHKKIVFHCQKGMRGKQALNIATQAFPTLTMYNLKGGIEAWKSANLPVLNKNPETTKTSLSLMRQVQIAAGSLVAIGSILALANVTAGTFLALFIGCGLLFAGLSGTCLLAKILTKMPWN